MQVDLYKEEEIVKGCQNNERKYQEILYRRYSRKMYGICMSYAGNRDLAQDMLHDAFLKIFRTIDSFKMEGSLEGWIRRVVSHTAIDLLRKKQRLDQYITEDMQEIQTSNNPSVHSYLATKEILILVGHLPDGARAIFNLFALEGFSHKEIAEQLQISEGTSKSQFNRARNLLKDWIENTQKQ
jgi:RNA polymerase sigma factor (sigma-70 family)